MSKLNRRNALFTGAAVSAPLILPNLAMGKTKSSNSKLNVAMIGSGGIARTCFRECEEENVVAIAEVDTVRGADGLKQFSGAEHYTDFRKMLDKHYKELDAVIINTPDHTHFPATYAAMERGIAVHTQKPLTHNIWQARTLQKAAHKFKVQTVMGNQGHNFEGMRLIKDWYDAGLIGNVREVHAWTGRTTTNLENGNYPEPTGEQVPSTLDWDSWIGPTSAREYSSKICPSDWRWYWDYGLGGLGDIGCHTLDIPKYVMGLGYPDSVQVDNRINFSHEFHDKQPKDCATTYVYQFGRDGRRVPVTVYWYEGGHLPHFSEAVKSSCRIDTGGCMMIGDKNTLFSSGMRPESPRLVNDWDSIRREIKKLKKTPRAVGNPVKELFAAVRGDIPKCGSNFDYAVPLTEMVILGTIAARSKKNVEYVPKSMTFKDPSLNQYVKEPVRKGWEYGEGLI